MALAAGAWHVVGGNIGAQVSSIRHDRLVTSAATHTEHGDRDLALAGKILRTVAGR